MDQPGKSYRPLEIIQVVAFVGLAISNFGLSIAQLILQVTGSLPASQVSVWTNPTWYNVLVILSTLPALLMVYFFWTYPRKKYSEFGIVSVPDCNYEISDVIKSVYVMFFENRVLVFILIAQAAFLVFQISSLFSGFHVEVYAAIGISFFFFIYAYYICERLPYKLADDVNVGGSENISLWNRWMVTLLVDIPITSFFVNHLMYVFFTAFQFAAFTYGFTNTSTVAAYSIVGLASAVVIGFLTAFADLMAHIIFLFVLLSIAFNTSLLLGYTVSAGIVAVVIFVIWGMIFFFFPRGLRPLFHPGVNTKKY